MHRSLKKLLLFGTGSTLVLAGFPLFSKGDNPKVSSDWEQKYVVLVTRHGYRTPLNGFVGHPTEWNDCRENILTANFAVQNSGETIPTNQIYSRKIIHSDEASLSGSCYTGQLTNVGREQMEGVGKILRERYVSSGDTKRLLPEILDTATLYIRSTDSKRTIETAQSVLHSMYPPEKRPASKDGILTIHSYDKSAENMYARSNCNMLSVLRKQVMETPAYKEHMQKYESLRELLKQQLNRKVSNWVAFYNQLQCFEGSKIPFPKVITTKVYNQIKQACSEETKFNFYTKDICMFSIGRFVHDITTAVSTAIKEDSNPRFFYYSGHDNTLSPLLSGLEILKEHPGMGSFLVFEFYQDSKKAYHVRVLLNDKVQNLPWAGGKNNCTLEQFEKHMKRLTPVNYTEQCKVREVNTLSGVLKQLSAQT